MNGDQVFRPTRAAWGQDRLSRRQFVVGAAAVAAAGGGTAVAVASMQPEPEPARTPICMAMHVHASASEGVASMQSQLVQAVDSGIDVLWWTEHDHRMEAHAAARRIEFAGRREAVTNGATWTWTPVTSGNPEAARNRFVTGATDSAVAPHGRAMEIYVRARAKRLGAHSVSGQAEDWLNRTTLAGLAIAMDVRPVKVSSRSFVAIEITTSYRPSSAGRPAGIYTLSYRIGGAGVPGVAKVVNGTTGIVYLRAARERWSSIRLQPELDLVTLWPGIDGRDSCLHDLVIVARANGPSEAHAYFADLRFQRADRQPLQLQRDIIRRYADQFPTVRQFQALEVSLTTPHLGWYGGRPALADYSAVGPLPVQDPAFARAAVDRIHASGGLASYCHPYGVSVTPLPPDRQEAARAAKSTELVRNRALGCDLLEVGYRLRGGCTLEQHESLWDNCSRNGIFLTGVGVSDDHDGMNWRHQSLNFVTWAWAASASEGELLDALRVGRVFFGDVARFGGALDLRLGGRSAMGRVSVSDADRRTLTVVATGLPEGAVVEVIRGTVDFAGPANTHPALHRSTLAADRFDGEGRTKLTIDTQRPRFVRLVVKDAAGLTIALSNPVWLLRRAVRPVAHARVLR